jgi:hypothetical protein
MYLLLITCFCSAVSIACVSTESNILHSRVMRYVYLGTCLIRSKLSVCLSACLSVYNGLIGAKTVSLSLKYACRRVGYKLTVVKHSSEIQVIALYNSQFLIANF